MNDLSNISYNVNELVEILKDLIRIESHIENKIYEKDIALYIYDFFKKLNINVRLQYVCRNRYNVIANIKGKSDKTIMFTGHMDTVPSYGLEDIFCPKVIDEKVYGRGACDMKGAIAAMLYSAKIIKEHNLIPNSNIIYAFVCDEEFQSLGTEKLIKSSIRADVAILGEPTNMNIGLGHKGLEWIDIEIIGKGGHGGTVEDGVNAIYISSKLINLIENNLIPKIKNRRDELLGSPTLNVGFIKGGEQPSTIPERCVIKLDRRYIFGESIQLIYDEINELLDEVRKYYKFNAVVKPNPMNKNEMEHTSYLIDKNHPIIRHIKDLSKNILKFNPKEVCFSGWTDAALIGNYAKIPTVILGPGNLNFAHCKEEHVSILELLMASKLYTLIAYTY